MLANIILSSTRLAAGDPKTCFRLIGGGLWYDKVAYFLDGVSSIFVYTIFQCKSQKTYRVDLDQKSV